MLTFLPILTDKFFYSLIFLGMKIHEGIVFQLFLNPVNSQSAGDGRVDIKGFLSDFYLFMAAVILQRPHIMETVRQLD